MILKTLLFGKTYAFRDVKDVLAKANEEKSGDKMAGIAAENAERLIVMRRGKIALDGAPEEVFIHAAELREMGLDIPGAASLAEELRARGVTVPQGVYTPQALAAALLARKEAGAC